MILKCICAHPAQDKIHGAQNRVANQTKDPTKAKCTVCGTLIKINNVVITKEKKNKK